MSREELKKRARRRLDERPDPHEDPGPRTSFGQWVWEWTKSLAVAFLVFLFVRTFVVEAFQIPTGSMEDTLLVGDYLLVNKAVYGAEIPGTDLSMPSFGRPDFQDIVVFEPPEEAGQAEGTSYVKRVMGLPGDTLAMRNGTLYRNGTRVEEPYAHNAGGGNAYSPAFSWQRAYLIGDPASVRDYKPTRDTWGPLEVPEGHYFVMGDNRANSEDSRYWGFVPEAKVKGEPLFIYYSYDREELGPFPWITEIRWGRLFSGV